MTGYRQFSRRYPHWEILEFLTPEYAVVSLSKENCRFILYEALALPSKVCREPNLGLGCVRNRNSFSHLNRVNTLIVTEMVFHYIFWLKNVKLPVFTAPEWGVATIVGHYPQSPYF